MAQKLGFGTQVEDTVTGIKGKVTHYAVHKSGCNTYLVQPPVGTDGKAPNPNWIPEQALSVLGETLAVLPTTPQVFDFDATVRDATSGFEGKVLAFSVQQHGANRYTVQPPFNKKKAKLPRALWFDEQNLELVEVPSAAAVARAAETKTKKPGGFASELC